VRVLVVVWDGAGSFTPERSLVRALVGRGHGVHVLGHDSLRDEVAEDGAHFEPLRSAPQYDSTTEMTPEEEFSFCFDGIWLSKGYAADTSAAIDRIKPDVVLVDAALAYAMAAALASGLPTVALWGTLYGLFAAGPYQQVLDSRMAEVNAYAAERGLAPAASHRAFLESAPLVLIFGFRQFDTVEDLPRPVRHVGPLRAPTSEVERWQRRRPRAPLVLVSLSTGYQAQAELLRKLGEALGGLEIEAIVTTGPAVSPDAVPAAGNTCVVRFVSHDAVLPQADLLISHAGHGTVMAGIVHGVPMLCLPMGRDQPAVAGRVVELGLGRLLDPRASVAEIRDAVAAALADRRIGETAVAFAASLAEHPGVEDAIVAIEDLIPDSAAERSA
jgi:MGT family glycosyltransferase